MTNKEYIKYLNILENEYKNFMKIAKKIIPEKSDERMKSLKSKSILANIKLRSILQKFRGNSCGCEFKTNKDN